MVLLLQLLCIFENADKVNLGGNEAVINLNTSIPIFHDWIYINTSSTILPKYLPSGLLICTNVTSLSHNWGLICWSDPWFLSLLLASYSLVPSLLSLPFNFICFTNFASHWYCLQSIPDLFQYPTSWFDLSIVLTPILSCHFPIHIFSVASYLLISYSPSQILSPTIPYISPRLQANKSISHYVLCSYFCSCNSPT